MMISPSDLSVMMLAASDELLLVVDPSNRHIVAANPRAATMLGLTVDELIGRPITDLERSLPDMFYWNEVASGHHQEIALAEGLYARTDGSLLAVEKSIRAIESNGQDWLVIRARDAQARQNVESELEHAMSMLRATLESVAEGILVIDLHGNIGNFNHRFAELWQLPSELLREGDDQVLFDRIWGQCKDSEQVCERFLELREARDSLSFDTLELLDGRVFECRSCPQMWRDQVLGRVFSITDITERMAVQHELADARDKALAASRAKSDFLSQMSHELRTPLNAIIGFAELLQEELGQEQQASLQAITGAGWHLLDLINEVLDLAKVEAGRLTVESKPVELSALLHDCLTLVAPLAERRAVRLAPLAAGQACWVMGDERRLRQVAFNLLSNAIKYNREQGEVSLHLERQANTMTLAVRDTGIGVSAEDQAKLFQPFSRVGSKQKTEEGAGIGLSFTRQLLQLMGGDISLQSEPGRGSVFTVNIPAAEPPRASQPTAAAPMAPAPGTDDITVLYIEDDPVSRLLLTRVFAKQATIRFFTADSGASGIALCEEIHPTLVLSDMNLGDMTGVEILQALRNRPTTCQVPVWALSANAMPSDIAEGLSAGFERYLTKPVDVAALLDAIRSWATSQPGTEFDI